MSTQAHAGTDAAEHLLASSVADVVATLAAAEHFLASSVADVVATLAAAAVDQRIETKHVADDVTTQAFAGTDAAEHLLASSVADVVATLAAAAVDQRIETKHVADFASCHGQDRDCTADIHFDVACHWMGMRCVELAVAYDDIDCLEEVVMLDSMASLVV